MWKKKCIRSTVFAGQRAWGRSLKIMATDWLAGAWSSLSVRNFVFSLVFTVLWTPCDFLFNECWNFFVKCKVARVWNKSHIFKFWGWKLVEVYFKTYHMWWVWCLHAGAAVFLFWGSLKKLPFFFFSRKLLKGGEVWLPVCFNLPTYAKQSSRLSASCCAVLKSQQIVTSFVNKPQKSVLLISRQQTVFFNHLR